MSLDFRPQNHMFCRYDNNTQRDATHAHSVLRNTRRYFGIDVLAEHHVQKPH